MSAAPMPAKVDTEPAEPARFVACEKFDGPREGYEFKSGSEGVGYYRAGTGPEEKAGDDEASLAPAPASKWRDPDDEGFDIESVPALTPEEIKASEDEERERVTRISAVRWQPRTASCPTFCAAARLLTVVLSPPVTMSAAGALDVGVRGRPLNI
jgi:hypothetical protein